MEKPLLYRLRRHKGGAVVNEIEAADEIERLQKALDQKTAEHADVVRRKRRKDEEIERLRGSMNYTLLKEQQAEIERLQAIENRLPKTKDGVRVVPGQDQAWGFRGGMWRQGWVVAQGAHDSGAVEISFEAGGWPVFCMPDVSDCYSTLEAAEAAQRAADRSKGDDRSGTD